MVESRPSNFFQVTTFNLSDLLSEEYVPFAEDLARMIVLQTVIHMMYFLRDPLENPLFAGSFVEIVLYIVLGVSAYWLIFKKLVKIV